MKRNLLFLLVLALVSWVVVTGCASTPNTQANDEEDIVNTNENTDEVAEDVVADEVPADTMVDSDDSVSNYMNIGKIKLKLI